MLSAKQLKEVTGLTIPTIYGAIKGMLEKDILREVTGHSRNRIYSLHRYFEIFSNDNKENGENL